MKMLRNRWGLLLAAMLVFSFVLSACGDNTATAIPTTTKAVATTTAAPVATTTAVATTTVATAVDLKAAADKFLSGLPDGFNTIGKVEDLKNIMSTGNAALIDVREASEYAGGHIPGFVNIPIRTLGKNLDKLPLDKPLVISCASGTRALITLGALQTIGYTNARAFTPSFSGWKAANETIATAKEEAKVYGAPKIDAQYIAAADKFFSNMPDGFYNIGKVEDLKNLMSSGNVTLIDVREPSEFAAGHIANFTNIPIRTLGKNLDKVPTDKPVVISCASGTRALISMGALQVAGYNNVRAFGPSFKGWQTAGEPVVK